MEKINKSNSELKIAIAHTYTKIKTHIQDETFTDSNSKLKSRFRRAIIILSKETFSNYYNKDFSLRDIYEEVLEMISIDLKAGYNFPIVSMEVFDHQARDWLLMKLEEYSNNKHPWHIKLKENSENVIVCCFCFGSMDSIPEDGAEKTLGLLPGTYCHLVNYSTDEGEILEIESWSLEKDGVLIPPEFLKQFGKPSLDSE